MHTCSIRMTGHKNGLEIFFSEWREHFSVTTRYELDGGFWSDVIPPFLFYLVKEADNGEICVEVALGAAGGRLG